jgi:hypothetical protein
MSGRLGLKFNLCRLYLPALTTKTKDERGGKSEG